MIFGGVPFYLEQLKKSASVAQNINQLCFSRDGLLNDEFDRLFKSLFEYAQEHMALIRMIAQKHGGVGRSELTKKGFSSGGQLSKRLGELEAAGFIQSFYPFGQRKEIFYKVCDPFSLFYLKWIDPIKSTGKHFVKQHLQSILNTPKWHNWTGYAFENVCFMHADELIEALGLDGICTSYSDYVIRGDVEYQGAQIDLLLERNDGAVTLCEMKYSHAQFSLDKKTAVPLMNKVKVLSQKLGSEIQIFIVLVTPKGLKKTIWVEELVDEVLTLEDF